MQKEKMQKMNGKLPSPHKEETTMQPEKRFRAGGIAATVWMHQTVRNGQPAVYASVNFDKRYKDKDGNWKSTTNLNVADIPKAIMVLGKAYEHLAMKQEEIGRAHV